MTRKILTVSIAAYNVEDYIEECLDHFTVLSDEILNKLEIIIIDDGGTDRTREIVNRYIGKYPNTFMFIHKKNGGWGSTVNTGIELATGKYFKQLDGDDYYNSKSFADFVLTLENIDADIIYSPYLEFQEGNGQSKIVGYLRTEKICHIINAVELCDMVENFSMHASTFKTALLKQNKIKLLEHCFYTDAELYIKAFVYAESIYTYPNYIYCYRLGRDGQSVSVDGLKKHYKDNEKVIDELIDYTRKIEVASDKKKAVMKNILKCIEFQYNVLIELNKIEELKILDKKIINQYNMDVDDFSNMFRRYRVNNFENAYDLFKKNERIRKIKLFFKHNMFTAKIYNAIRLGKHNICCK